MYLIALTSDLTFVQLVLKPHFVHNQTEYDVGFNCTVINKLKIKVPVAMATEMFI